MSSRPAHLLLLACTGAMAACSAKQQPALEPPPLPVPIQMTVRQRSTTDVPGAHVPLQLTIDDVTAGRVTASLLVGGKRVCPAVSLREGASAPFKLDGQAYVLHLENLDNALVGEDYATFVITSATGEMPDESARIEQLIQSVASLKNAVFIRNGEEHSVEDAVEHMRRKWQSAGDRVHTAEQFIEHAASRSSISGRPYQIRFADGRVLTTREFLTERLRVLDANR